MWTLDIGGFSESCQITTVVFQCEWGKLVYSNIYFNSFLHVSVCKCVCAWKSLDTDLGAKEKLKEGNFSC